MREMMRTRLIYAIGLALCILFFVTGEVGFGVVGFVVLILAPWPDIEDERSQAAP